MSNAEAVAKPVGMNSTGISQALLLYGICFALVLFIGSLIQGLSFKIGLAATLIFLMLLPAIVFIRSKKVGLAEGLRLRAVRPSIFLSSFFLGFGTWGVGMLIARALDDLGLKSMSQGLDVGLNSPMGFATSLLVAAVGPGICEESLFRGAIQGVLERKGKWFGVIVTAVLFGLVHMMLGLAIPTAVMGFFYGWVVIRTGSILPAMVAHFANNAAALSFLYFLNAEDPSWLIPSCIAVGVIAIVAIMRLSSDRQGSIASSPLSEVPAALPLWSSLGCMLPLMTLAVAVVGLSSALPYVMQSQTLDSGERVMYADQDSVLFRPTIDQGNARVVYARGEKLMVGQIVELSNDTTRIRDKDGNEIEIPTTDIVGVVLYP